MSKRCTRLITFARGKATVRCMTCGLSLFTVPAGEIDERQGQWDDHVVYVGKKKLANKFGRGV